MSESSNQLMPSLPERQSSTTNGRAIAVILKPLIDLHGMPKNWTTAAPLYIEALADIPLELLAVAVKHSIVSNPYFPKPAELRACISDELADYRRRQHDRRLAQLPKPEEPAPPTAEDIAYVDAIVGAALKGIAGRRRAMMDNPRAAE